MTTEELYAIYRRHPVICTDTRAISAGCLFFALKGEKFNGNTFAEQALTAGAAYAVIDEPERATDDRCLLVNDVLTALQDLARHHRRQLTIPVIGITGTNGKTTTKELIYSVLRQHYRSFATAGNLNNHIGVPLSVLAIGSETEIAVIEMGANHQKEIEFLCSIAQPSHGLITNVGKAHLEGFGGYEGVKKGKGELYAFLVASKGVIFINRDNAELLQMLQDRNGNEAVTYGTSHEAELQGRIIASQPYLSMAWQVKNDEEHPVESRLTGGYNIENLLAAIAIGHYFGLSAAEINAGITAYTPRNNRSQLQQTEHNLLICDYYNANPGSMAVALDNLATMPAENKVIVLGDMFELGEDSPAEHLAVLRRASKVAAARRIYVGTAFCAFRDEFPGDEFYPTTPLALAALADRRITGSTVLVKGSRGMKLETLLGEL